MGGSQPFGAPDLDELEEPGLEEPGLDEPDEPLAVEEDVLVDVLELERSFELEPLPPSLLDEGLPSPEEPPSAEALLSPEDFAAAPAVAFSWRLSLR